MGRAEEEAMERRLLGAAGKALDDMAEELGRTPLQVGTAATA